MAAFGYPVSLDLEGRRCVVVGGGTVAEHKVQGLLDAGAAVTVVAGAFTSALRELAARGEVELLHRPYARGDLAGAFLTIAATDDGAVNAEVFAEASEGNVLCNAVDDVAHCHFAAPSIVRRGDLTISVSTGGKAPALAKRLRQTLSAQFGDEWGVLVDVLAESRAAALARNGGTRDVDFATWAERWALALDGDLAGMVRDGRAAEVAEIVRSALAGEPPSRSDGSVAIVGAGPGDPGLISVRGRQLLDAADVVVYDRLVHPSLWEGKDAVDAGKEPGAHRVDQAQINELLVRLAREGRRVVRLKGGDPFVFGRGAEEVDALAAAGIRYEVVPGVTSAVAALGAAGIPVTDRRVSSSFAVVTGHCATGEVDWDRLAMAVDTLVVLMGLRRLPEIVERLLAAGRPGDTPAAVVGNGSLPDQRVVTSTLAELPAAVALAGVSPPAVIVVGDVVRLRGSDLSAARDPLAERLARPS
ncbi:MAG: uroporphyrin-III C-methyltransferase / precorrin-2 dehydrogenase / sirohydrochlorin ferrochelatase [Actinomycetota bacterium]|nr:uroporphyrin-III C-methyltransferase / precorrin-2 dehydrogenase / sirohydrochlorin ferrochelatase [Actinomycetota bacterium]